MLGGRYLFMGTRKYGCACIAVATLRYLCLVTMLNRHTFSTFDHQKVIDLLNLYNMYLPLHYLRRLVYYTPDEDVSNQSAVCV